MWHTDRLFRQPRDLERLIELGDRGFLVASAHGSRNLADPDDRFILRIEVAHAARSSDDTSRRLKRRFQTMREHGQSNRGAGSPGSPRSRPPAPSAPDRSRAHFEDGEQAYVLRVQKNFRITLPGGAVMSCAQAVKTLLKHKRSWEIRSAGKGSKGDRWYAWAWIATASPRHHLLIRKHLRTNELAFHYCFVPEGQPLTKARLVRAAGLRWPVEEGFEFGKDCFGLDQSQVRLYTAIARHTVLVCAALAVCAVTAALLRDRTDSQAPEPVHPDQPPPTDPGRIPLTTPEIKHLIADATITPRPPEHRAHWVHWRGTHQARSRWFHKRTRLARNIENTQVS